jgi:uncharacterized membrane protein
MGAGMALIITMLVRGHGILLLDVSPLRLVIAGLLGASGALLVEHTHRSVAVLSRMDTTCEQPSPETRS